jgi:hypothetical protein
MKWLSLLSLLCLSLTLTARIYAYYTFKSLDLLISQSKKESVFDEKPDEAKKLLAALADIPIDKKILKENHIAYDESLEVEQQDDAFPVSNLSLDANKLNNELEEAKIALITAYNETSNNIRDILSIQSDISNLKAKLDTLVLPTESWDPRLVFYLEIREGLQLEDIDQLENLADIGISIEEIKNIRNLINTPEFLHEILIFKGVDDSEIELAVTSHSVERKLASAIDRMRDSSNDQVSINDNIALEAKLVEMDYTDSETEEMSHGYDYDNSNEETY